MKPVNIQGLKQGAYTIIKEKLLNLEIEPGSRIREDLLAEEISMSRTPVREAINQLAAEGFITIVPRKGLFAVLLTHDEIKHLVDVRESLEKLAIQKCIERITDDQLTELDELMARMEETVANEDFQLCNQLDSDFHLRIAQITENTKLLKFLMEIEDMMHIVRNMVNRQEDIKKTHDRRQRSLAQHKAILKCIREKNADKAIAELERDIECLREQFGIES